MTTKARETEPDVMLRSSSERAVVFCGWVMVFCDGISGALHALTGVTEAACVRRYSEQPSRSHSSLNRAHFRRLLIES